LALKLITPPALEPISLADAKTHLRVDLTEDDTLISALISATRDYVERYCRRGLLTQTWLLAIDHFPGAHDYQPGFWDYGVLGDAALGLGLPPVGYTYETKSEVFYRAGQIVLPLSPLQSVDSVQYLDQNGVLQTMDPDTDYQVDNVSEPGRIAPAANTTWPLTQISVRAPVLNAVKIQYTLGFGDATTDESGDITLPPTFPPTLIAAMKLLLGHFYENRQEVITGLRAAAVQIPMAAKSLLWANRVYRVP